MSKLDQILALSDGASFFRGDLHIHSYGNSHDVSDQTMTPSAVVAKALAENLSLIAITDHNEISGVAEAIQAAAGTSLTVIPGVELSTSDGHLLCYLPDLDRLQQFHARLSLADRGLSNSRCKTSMLGSIELADQFGGFCILAHIDGAKGFEVEVPGNAPHKADVIKHKGLLAIELKDSTTDISYSPQDPDSGRKIIGNQRATALGLGLRQFLARVVSSDAHKLGNVGQNASGKSRITRYKMQTPSFRGLMLALLDGEVRVRIEDEIPFAVPHVVGIYMEGSFFSGTAIKLSKNLNCIVGGRGAGKSTALEAIRLLSADGGGAYMLDSEVWPTEIDLFWKNPAEITTALSRKTGAAVVNLSDPIDGPTVFDMDCFGQGDAATISKTADNDPLALLNYLDKFIELSHAKSEEEQAQQELLNSQKAIENAKQQVALIPAWEQRLKVANAQLTALETAKAKEVIALQRQLSEEKEQRQQIVKHVQNIRDCVTSTTLSEETTRFRAISPVPGVKNAQELQTILSGVSSFEAAAATSKSDLAAHYNQLTGVVTANLTQWKARDQAATDEIEAKRKALESQGIRLDMGFIQKLTNDAASANQNLGTLATWTMELQQLQKERAAILQRRWAARGRISTLRTAFATRATSVLGSALKDLTLSLKYKENAYSLDAERLITNTMGWRTVQVPRAAILVQELTIPKLLAAIRSQNATILTNVQSTPGVPAFTKSDAEGILAKLNTPELIHALEHVHIDDLPKLTVTRMTYTPGQPPKPRIREFTQLSLGQQQSVLLALMLSSDRTQPLLIDQPEDNLDSEFIYSTLVPVLRRAKERRQIIVVTHNANIAVLSDAEQIIVLKSTSEKASILHRGSIDHPGTRDAACEILEGAHEAFRLRAKLYGFS
ncbi:MAG: TrlF family AAA-like ATPase [Solirubrobacteraceae bacterium]